MKIFIKKHCSFLYFYVNMFYLVLFIDIDTLEGYREIKNLYYVLFISLSLHASNVILSTF